MKIWRPLTDGVYNYGTIHIENSGEWLAIDDRDSDGLKSYLGTSMENNFRVCELVEIDIPKPDWSIAPEWANWWAADGDGESYWFEMRPTMDEEGVLWFPDAEGKMIIAGCSKIPVGVDWRLLIEKNPENKEELSDV